MRKRVLSVLMTLCMVLSLVTPALAAEETEGKTLTVDMAATGDGAYTTIQEAIDYINGQSDKTGWTIKVEAGTYERFNIPHSLNGLTITGVDKDSVIVETLNTAIDNGLSDSGGDQCVWRKYNVGKLDYPCRKRHAAPICRSDQFP